MTMHFSACVLFVLELYDSNSNSMTSSVFFCQNLSVYSVIMYKLYNVCLDSLCIILYIMQVSNYVCMEMCVCTTLNLMVVNIVEKVVVSYNYYADLYGIN